MVVQKINQLSNPESWIDEHGDYLFRYSMMRLRNAEQAEDMVQETLVAALKAQERFSGNSTERTWLTGILKHKIIDYIRKAQRERPMTEFENDEGDSAIDGLFNGIGHWKNAPGEWEANPAELLERQQFWTVLDGCMSKLPEKLSHAFAMKMIDHEDSDEICKVLDITPTNLWVMLHRARGRLRQCLEINWFGKESEEKKS